MTRINLVPPSELTDQHLFAEFREIKHVPHALSRSLNSRGLDGVLAMVPPEFTLNKGHVSFFYNKGLYLLTRFYDIRRELERRDFNFDYLAMFDEEHTFASNPALEKTYTPTPAALVLIRKRISEKIAMKPTWYRYYGKPLFR